MDILITIQIYCKSNQTINAFSQINAVHDSSLVASPWN